MWDPISIFYVAWVLNIGMPEARLNVSEVIESKEQKIIVEHISNSVTIREGI